MSNVIERVATQAAGSIGAISASIKGLRGVFLRLPEEHREVLVLVQRAAASDDHEKRLEVWTDARRELLAHERAELQTVYPELALHAALHDITQQHDSLADELEAAVAEIDAQSVDAPGFLLALQNLEGALRRHAEFEEEHFFPRAQAILGNARAVEIEGLYTNARRSILHALKFPTHDDPADGR